MMDTNTTIDRFLAAQSELGQLVEQVGDQEWQSPTPCSSWSVHDLVNHLVGEQLWATPMLDGETIEQVGSRLDGDLLGDDRIAAWRSAAKESASAFGAPGALDRTINSSMGPSPASQYLAEMTCDLILHRWDLGQAITVEQRFSSDELEQVQAMAEALAPNAEQLVSAGIFAAAKPVAADADRQSKLLAAVGRVG